VNLICKKLTGTIFMRKNAIVIGSISSLCTAVYKSLDNYTMHNLITAPDNLTAAFAYLIIGGWTGVISMGVFSLVFGKLIDPTFTGITINNPKMHRQALISGSISAFTTLFVMLGNQIGDPSAIVALANLTVIYTIIHDIKKKQTTLKQILIPSILVVAGGMFAAFNGSLTVTALGFFYVVILSNGLDAYTKIVETSGIKDSDSVNLLFWRFFWLALTGTVLALFVSFFTGHLKLLYLTVQGGIIHLHWVVMTMFFVFLGMGLSFYMRKAKPLSMVLLITSTQILFTYPITILGSWIQPKIFGDIFISPMIWLIRGIGLTLIILGIIQLEKRGISIQQG
jgi:hypothetical protein